MIVQLKPNGQYVVTIDKGIGQGMELEGAEVEFSISSRNKLVMKVIERDNEGDKDDQ